MGMPNGKDKTGRVIWEGNITAAGTITAVDYAAVSILSFYLRLCYLFMVLRHAGV